MISWRQFKLIALLLAVLNMLESKLTTSWSLGFWTVTSLSLLAVLVSIFSLIQVNHILKLLVSKQPSMLDLNRVYSSFLRDFGDEEEE